MAEAKRRARRRRLLLAVVAVLIAGGALGAALGVRSSNGSGGAGARVASDQILNPVPDGAADCGRGVSGGGFRVWACMSGGAAAGHPHPKELLVARSDGSSDAYPEWGGQGVAAGDGEVVAFHDLNVVRVTSSRLVPLVTTSELARALYVRRTAILWPMYDLRVDARGGVYFVASYLNRSGKGCQNRMLERTAQGRVRQIRALRSSVCS